MAWRKIRDSLKRLRTLDGSLLLVARFFQITTGNRIRLVRYYVVAQPVPPGGETRPRGSSARSTTELIERSNPIVGQFPRPPEIISARFNAGHLCFTTAIADRFAGYLWLARTGYDEDEVRCRYEFGRPELSAWDFDVYVAPEFRASRAFVRLWDAANHYMDAAGVHWTFSRISAFSKRSLRSHAKLRMQTLFSATFLCVGRLQISLFGKAPHVHVSLSERTRPVLTLAPPPEAAHTSSMNSGPAKTPSGIDTTS